jgi:hypothetical protein
MKKIMVFSLILILVGCASKKILKEPSTYDCLSELIGGYKIKEWCGFSDSYCSIEKRTCEMIRSDLNSAVEKNLTPVVFEEWNKIHKGKLDFLQIVEWFSLGFNAVETKYWLKNNIPSNWAVVAKKTQFEPGVIQQLIKDKFTTNIVLELYFLDINQNYWLSLIGEGLTPHQAKLFIKTLDVTSKHELITALSENTYQKYQSQLKIDNWVCSRANQIGKLKRLSRVDVEVVVRYLIMNKAGTIAPNFSLFIKHEFDTFNLKSKLERYKGDVSNWAGCPEYVIDRMNAESEEKR